MIHTLFSQTSLNSLLPKEMKDCYEVTNLLTANQHNIILNVHFKKTGSLFVLKILDKKYYNKVFYQKIFGITDTSLLLPIQTFTDPYFIYFLYPQLKTLTEVLSTNSVSCTTLCTLIRTIGNSVVSLHKHNILHLDLTPSNIFVDQEEHFYLGDFSSAVPAKRYQALFFCHFLRTGTTSTFAPPNKEEIPPISYWNDCYNLSLFIYVLFNNGKLPDQNVIAPNPAISELNAVLLKWMKLPSSVHSNTIKEFLEELEQILIKYNNHRDFQKYNLLIEPANDKQNFLWENTPECDIENISVPKTAFFKLSFSHKNSKKIPLYSLFIFCSFLFLFSLYHYLVKSNKAKSNQITFQSEQLIIPVMESPQLKNTLPTPTISPLPKSTMIPIEKKGKPILDISENTEGSNILKKNFTKNHTLQILFANQCRISNCNIFASLYSLKELYLSDNQITSLKGITNLSNLEVLVISKNRLTDLSCLTHLKSLKALDLSHNQNLKDISVISSLKNLHYLILTNTNISEKTILTLQKQLPECTIFY